MDYSHQGSIVGAIVASVSTSTLPWRPQSPYCRLEIQRQPAASRPTVDCFKRFWPI